MYLRRLYKDYERDEGDVYTDHEARAKSFPQSTVGHRSCIKNAPQSWSDKGVVT